jgi:cytochrome b involved in lipid metabolism
MKTNQFLKHNNEGNLVAQWIIIDPKVYDLSRFVELHPGGSNVLYNPKLG